ncbi:MAG TPA: Dabb family protein [Flavitalea sp.]|nr:Dabb family protein [Flavitalea sp.]
MIRHTVVFKLKPSKDSKEELNFFVAARKLKSIPGVQNFECLKQISKKNKFEFGLSMEFTSRELYDNYSAHPEHIIFVKDYWLKDVEDFLEIDYVPM